MLELALGYHTWRTLVQHAGLSQDAAIEAMIGAIAGAGKA
jgi:hypothetical protein